MDLRYNYEKRNMDCDGTVKMLIEKNFDQLVETLKDADKSALMHPDCEYQVYICEDGDCAYEKHTHGDSTWYVSNLGKRYLYTFNCEGFDIVRDWYYSDRVLGEDAETVDIEDAADAYQISIDPGYYENIAREIMDGFEPHSLDDFCQYDILFETLGCDRDVEHRIASGSTAYSIDEFVEEQRRWFEENPDDLEEFLEDFGISTLDELPEAIRARRGNKRGLSYGDIEGFEYVIEWVS